MLDGMRMRDTSDVLASSLAIVADALTIGGGFLLATWIRFDSGWIPLSHDALPPRLYFMYGWGAVIATLVFLFLFRTLGLYLRPQNGTFSNCIPRLVRAVSLSMLLTAALAFAIRLEPPYQPFSRVTVKISDAFRPETTEEIGSMMKSLEERDEL